MYSGDLFVRPVFVIPGKTDIWEFQILPTIGLINPKYQEIKKSK